MKNIIFIVILLFMLLPFAASANQLPTSTWQVYGGGILTVYSGEDSSTTIVYQGDPDLYDGSATSRFSSNSILVNNINVNTRWEVYSAGILTVHSDDSQNSSIIYSGPPEDYIRILY